jgi:hypothetical protein
MPKCIVRIVVVILMTATVAMVALPCFDLQPTSLRTSHRTLSHLVLKAVSALPITTEHSANFAMPVSMQPVHPEHDIVVRDCARLC